MQANELFTQPNTILLDGGMGTMLQAAGLKLGARPEELNITDPQLIESIHSRYAAAGSRIINANTFGASAHKLAGSEYTLEEIIAAGIANCKRACAPYGALAALDVGPLGELLEPNGTLAFEDAVAEYGRIVRAGVAAGADLVFFEAFTDLYELKAALLAAKENCGLPILASMSFEAGGRTFTGCTVESFAVTARGLGANAVGINCSLGPKEIFPMAKRLAEALPGDFPVFVKPNAGLPRADGSGYDITPQLFAMEMKPYRDLKLFAAGGCCGTTPDFIKLLNGVFADCKPGRPAHAMPSVLCSPMDFVTVDGITVVGERINPTGKKRFQQALREGDMNYILEQAVSQSEAGAQVLDVNVGAPGVDEPAVMEQVVKALQSVVSLPLQLDSSHADALERGLRVYNGKPIVNSVNGETEVLERVLRRCKKYGAAVVGLAIDERGIQPSADARFEIAKRVVDAALAHGIPREDIYIDCLTLTASAQQQDVLATVEALARCKKELGVRTILGVSNISFGLPCRPYLNTTFLTMAMYAGLDLAIMNPSSEEMMAAVYSYNVLTNRDKQSMVYIARYADKVPASAALKQAQTAQASQTSNTPAEADAAHSGPFAALMQAVEKGLKGEAAARTHTLLDQNEPLTLVDEALIPALDVVGEKYEKGKLFLPQLLQAASAAQAAFEEIKTAIAKRGGAGASKGRIVLATVKGDVHDIGKNIVAVVMACNGYEIRDLGVMVEAQRIVDEAAAWGADAICLSGLITPSLDEMIHVVEEAERRSLHIPFIIGGATTSDLHTAVKIAPCTAAPVIHSRDASENNRILAALLGPDCETYVAEVQARQQRLRDDYLRRERLRDLISVADARRNRRPRPASQIAPAAHTGRLVFPDFDIADVEPFIDWNFFFPAWGLKGRCPDLFDHPERGDEARKLFDDAQALLHRIADERLLTLQGVVGIYPAVSRGDDILLTDAKGRRHTLPMLRNQTRGAENLCLSDFIADRRDGATDYIGAFALTAGIGLQELCDKFRSEGDDYSAIMAKLLADRLTEAFAEVVHSFVRRQMWGYETAEAPTPQQVIAGEYRGRRMAFGYPASPDHSLKREIFDLLAVEQTTRMRLTENWMISPGEALCGLFFSDARYFSVGQIDAEQLRDYAERRGLAVETVEKIIPNNV